MFFYVNTQNFSCIDKKGILSWPNPTAESIWLFKNTQNSKTKHYNSQQHDAQNKGNDEAIVTNGNNNSNNSNKKTIKKSKEPVKLETFNLTHHKTDPFKLNFDDVNWLSNINLFKPLVSFKILFDRVFLRS